jgi:hypothetical protein
MTRWLLNTFSTWALAIVVVGALVLFAAGGQYLVRRRWPQTAEGEHNDVAGVLLGLVGAVYGIVLAFVIVALYEDHQAANAVVRQEATEIEQIHRGSDAFADDVRAEIRRELADYTGIVIAAEWELMEDGRFSPRAWERVDALYATLQGYRPRTETQSVFYGEAVAKLDDLVTARRERLHFAEESLPGTFQALIIGGALLLIAFMFFIGIRSVRVQMTMIVALAALVGVNLLLVVLLDHPFSGDVAVSSHPFEETALVVSAGGSAARP